MRNVKNKNEKENDNVKLRQTKRSIYTNEMLDELRFMTQHHDLKRNEIMGILRQRYPDKKITDGNLNNVISRYNIKFKAMSRGRYSKADEPNIELINILSSNPFYIDNTPVGHIEENSVITEPVTSIESADADTILYEEDSNSRPIDELNEPIRFEPVRAEVHSVFNDWFKDKNCSVERDFQTSDYIDMIGNLIYLAENVDYIIKARNDQHDIANCYQSDVLHEQENVVLEDGNTYLSDKMHVIRNCRRFIEYDSNNMNAMKPILKSINVSEFKRILAILQKYEENRKHPVFIPMIDKSMVDKYEWAKEGSADSGKLANKPILVTNNRIRNTNKSVNHNSRPASKTYFKAYVIHAKLLDDTEEFNWERRYYATTSADALLKAKAEITKQFPAIKILNMECV